MAQLAHQLQDLKKLSIYLILGDDDVSLFMAFHMPG